MHGNDKAMRYSKEKKWFKYIFIAVIIIVFIICAIVFWVYNNMRIDGKISVADDRFHISDAIECKYEFVHGVDKDIAVNCENIQNSVLVKNTKTGGYNHGCYTYFFVIYGQGISVNGQLDFYSARDDTPEKWNLMIDFRQTDDKWDAVIMGDGVKTSIECCDIEANGIHIEYSALNDSICLFSGIHY